MAYKTCGQCGSEFSFNFGEEWKKICLECWLKNKNKEREQYKYKQSSNPGSNQPKAKTIDPNMLKILIMLCHPDKHNNSQASTKATTYLLGLR